MLSVSTLPHVWNTKFALRPFLRKRSSQCVHYSYLIKLRTMRWPELIIGVNSESIQSKWGCRRSGAAISEKTTRQSGTGRPARLSHVAVGRTCPVRRSRPAKTLLATSCQACNSSRCCSKSAQVRAQNAWLKKNAGQASSMAHGAFPENLACKQDAKGTHQLIFDLTCLVDQLW